MAKLVGAPGTSMQPFFLEFGDEPSKLIYPGDHQVGMRVPLGGSNCHKCKFVRNNEKDCAQTDFIAWNGSEELPLPADVYCCDFFQIAGWLK